MLHSVRKSQSCAGNRNPDLRRITIKGQPAFAAPIRMLSAIVFLTQRQKCCGFSIDSAEMLCYNKIQYFHKN